MKYPCPTSIGTEMARELLFSITPEQCVLETFRAGGKGGQNQNKRDTGVRYRHPPSGAVGESREERSQWQNRQKAWRRMAEHPKMKIWINNEAIIRQGLPSAEQLVEKMMDDKNIRTEIKDSKGRWKAVEVSDLV